MVSAAFYILFTISGQLAISIFSGVVACLCIYLILQHLSESTVSYTLKRMETIIHSCEQIFSETASSRQQDGSLSLRVKEWQTDINLLSKSLNTFSRKIQKNAKAPTLTLFLHTSNHLRDCQKIINELSQVTEFDAPAQEKIKLFRNEFFQFALNFYKFRTSYPKDEVLQSLH